MLNFVNGVFVGGFIGMLTMCLPCASSQASHIEDNQVVTTDADTNHNTKK